jgi:hypothetical protein
VPDGLVGPAGAPHFTEAGVDFASGEVTADPACLCHTGTCSAPPEPAHTDRFPDRPNKVLEKSQTGRSEKWSGCAGPSARSFCARQREGGCSPNRTIQLLLQIFRSDADRHQNHRRGQTGVSDHRWRQLSRFWRNAVRLRVSHGNLKRSDQAPSWTPAAAWTYGTPSSWVASWAEGKCGRIHSPQKIKASNLCLLARAPV